MEFTITNTYREWVEVSRVVFESVDMKIYYGDFVASTATMRVVGPNIAETDFIDAPPRPGMVKSIELYTARKIGAQPGLPDGVGALVMFNLTAILETPSAWAASPSRASFFTLILVTACL